MASSLLTAIAQPMELAGFPEWRNRPLPVLPRKGGEALHPGPCPVSYLDNIETRTVLGPSSDADPNQVLGVLLQGDLSGHSGDSSEKRSKGH